jgi:hypothetical protein
MRLKTIILKSPHTGNELKIRVPKKAGWHTLSRWQTDKILRELYTKDGVICDLKTGEFMWDFSDSKRLKIFVEE